MTTASMKCLTATLAITLGSIGASGPLARSGGPAVAHLEAGSFDPSMAHKVIFIAPALAVGPASGPTGSKLRVRTNGVLGSSPAIVVFETELSALAPISYTVRLEGKGDTFTAKVPALLCRYGRQRWDVHVSLTNRHAIRNVGTFMPTNC